MGCGASKPPAQADAEQPQGAGASAAQSPSPAVPPSAPSPTGPPPASPQGDQNPLIKTETGRSNRPGPLKMLTSRADTNRTTTTSARRTSMMGRLLGGAGAGRMATRRSTPNDEKSSELTDGSRRLPAVQDMTPNATVGCYVVAFTALAIAFIFAMLQLRTDFELAKPWEQHVCTVVQPAELARLERAHGGNACVEVLVKPATQSKDFTVSLNAAPEATWFPEEDELRQEAQKIIDMYPEGSTAECWLSARKRYVKLADGWRHEHQGCRERKFDLMYKPYVFFLMTLLFILVFRLIDYDEFRAAWEQSDAPGSLPEVGGPKPDFVTKAAWATEPQDRRQPQMP